MAIWGSISLKIILFFCTPTLLLSHLPSGFRDGLPDKNDFTGRQLGFISQKLTNSMNGDIGQVSPSQSFFDYYQLGCCGHLGVSPLGVGALIKSCRRYPYLE